MLRTGENNNNNSHTAKATQIDVIKQWEWQLLCEGLDAAQADLECLGSHAGGDRAAADDLQCGKSLHGETSAVDETRLTSERHKVFSLFT